jgi:GTP cyclohydrolase IA
MITEVSPAPLSPLGTARDLAAAEVAAAAMLTALGVDLSADSMTATPRRMVRALADMLTPDDFQLTMFPNEENYRHLVVVRTIRFQSLCEHHMLPFTGHAHVGYLPDKQILGLSKLARVVESFARRPQVQERLTQQIAHHLQQQLRCHGVGVVIDAEHTCMSLRGVRAEGANTVTVALLGSLQEQPIRAEFMSLVTETGRR